MKCKYCNTELVRYTKGGLIFKGYPYESGYACPKCQHEWSDLQISKGEHLPTYGKSPIETMQEKKEKLEKLEKQLRTPRDISKESLEDQANTLTLAFIGFIAVPTGISKELLEKCCEAFNNNRGQFEWEMDAILKVLKEDK